MHVKRHDYKHYQGEYPLLSFLQPCEAGPVFADETTGILNKRVLGTHCACELD